MSPIDADVERELNRLDRRAADIERRAELRLERLGGIDASLATIKTELGEARSDVAKLEERLEGHVTAVADRFAERDRERKAEQSAAEDRRRNEFKWRIGTAIAVLMLIATAVAVLLNAINSAG